MPPSKAEQALIDANAIVGQFLPLIGIAGIAVRAIIALLRSNGQVDAAATFEAELAKAEAARGDLRKALDDFHAKYPIAPEAQG